MTKAQYLEEANRRLQNHPDFEPGMRFVFSPPGSTEAIASGYDWEPDPSAMHPFSGIATALNAEVVVIG